MSVQGEFLVLSQQARDLPGCVGCLEEPHCSECQSLGCESMVAICEVEVSGTMCPGFFWAVLAIWQVVHCLPGHLPLDTPWNLLGDQQDREPFRELVHILLLVCGYGLRRSCRRWCCHTLVFSSCPISGWEWWAFKLNPDWKQTGVA